MKKPAKIEADRSRPQPDSWVERAYDRADKGDGQAAADIERELGKRTDEVRVEITSELTWSATLRLD